MLGVGRHDLVGRAEREPGDDDVHALRRRLRQRDILGGHGELLREERTHALHSLDHGVEVRLPGATVGRLPAAQLGHRVEGLPRQRAVGAGIEVRELLEHREPRPFVCPAHPMSTSTGA